MLLHGDVNWRSHCGKQLGGFSKNLKVELPHDPATLLPGVYPKTKPKILTRKNIHTAMLTAALFTVPRTWERPKTTYVNKVMLHSHKKRTKICHFQQLGGHYTVIYKSDRGR